MTPEIRHLLGGYSTGTLTGAERARLFAAALEDQDLFDALAEEQPLKDLLDDPESRGYLLAELDQLGQTEAPAAVMMSKARSAPVPVSRKPLPPPPQPGARLWLPFSAVMLALIATGWFWWKHEPVPSLQQVAVNAPPIPVMPVMPSQAAQRNEAKPAVAARRIAAGTAKASGGTSAAPAGPATPAEVRQELGRADATVPVLADKAAKKEREAVSAEKAEDSSKVLAEAMAPKPQPLAASPPLAAAGASGVVGNVKPAYRLMRLENGQYVPTAPTVRFQAGDLVVILLPIGTAKPELALANGVPVNLEREGDWYRSATVELQAGPQEFIVTPDATPVRSRFAGGRDAKAKEPQPLRIRLNVE